MKLPLIFHYLPDHFSRKWDDFPANENAHNWDDPVVIFVCVAELLVWTTESHSFSSKADKRDEANLVPTELSRIDCGMHVLLTFWNKD
jgi:hypothetical protein